MITEQRIKELIFESLRNVKDSDDVSEDFDLNNDTVLLGAGAVMDSIAYVSFTTDLEEKIEDEIGKEFVLKLHEIHDLNKGKTALIVGDMARIVAKIIVRDYAND